MIQTEQLTRHFRSKKSVVEAVRGIDLRVREGELVALLGPNGAGKSTTLRMLTTLLAPTAGRATVGGIDVVADPMGVRRKIGFIGQGSGGGHSYQVRDELVTQGRCYGMSRVDAQARADELMDTLQLADLAKRSGSSLSGGQRRRMDVALGLMHRPPLLFLDEPSTGMDPHNRANLWEHILAMRQKYGTTIVLTTHYMDEAERVVVIDHGKIIADDTPDRLKQNLAGDRIRLTVDAGWAEEAQAVVAPAASEVVVSRNGDDAATLDLRVGRADVALPPLLHCLNAAGVPVRAATLKQPTLDDVFLGLTGRSLREEGEQAP